MSMFKNNFGENKNISVFINDQDKDHTFSQIEKENIRSRMIERWEEEFGEIVEK